MGVVTAKLEGFKELERVLKRLPKRLAERELTSAARAGANVIRKAVRARAPKGGELIGQRITLKKSIRVTRIKKTGHSVEMAIHTGGAFWGMFLERGTAKMGARPFMGPAFDASSGPAVARLGKVLAKRVEKTARELAGPLAKISKATRRRL